MGFDLDATLREALRLGASDLHVKALAVPRVRVHGELVELPGQAPITHDDVADVLALTLTSARRREQLERLGSADLSYATDDGRFRVAAFSQRGVVSFVFRAIPTTPDPEALGIPDVVCSWADLPRGLIVVSGPTGSGKSTTTACLIGLINARRACHIVTIEDPIEFVHLDGLALISQREIGVDAPDHHQALRAALRQDPDVILVGEVRDEETARTALRAAETGHLVICTMHTIDAAETVQRFADLCDPGSAEAARRMLAATLVGIVSQRLVQGSGGGRRLNAEVLVNSRRVADLIAGDFDDATLRQAIVEGEYYGMRTFDQDLLAQVRDGLVGRDAALAVASSPHDLTLALTLG